MNDLSLIELLRHDPERGLCELTRQYTGLVFAVVRGKLAGACIEADIEECVSDAFIEFFRMRDQFDPDRGSIKTMLAVIARRRAVNRFERALRERTLFSPAGLSEEAAKAPSPEDEIEDREARKAVFDEISALGEPDREILVRKYYFGESTKEIAKKLRMKPSAVDTRAHRAVMKLKSRLGGKDEN